MSLPALPAQLRRTRDRVHDHRARAVSVTRGAPARWRSSDVGERGFCAACGSLLTIRVDFQADTVDIAAATLDQPELVEPGFHIFCGAAIPWGRIDDGLPRHERFRPNTRGLAPEQASAASPRPSR